MAATPKHPSPRLLLAAALLICGLLAAVLPAAAAPEQPFAKPGDITLSPTQQDITVNSGLIEATTKLTLTNHTDRDVLAGIRAVDFDASGESGAIAWDNPAAASGKYGLVKWLVLPLGDTVLLPKGQTVQVPVNIQNRADLAPGGHYAGLVVRPAVAAASATGSRVDFKQELISLLFVKKLGGAKFGLQLESLAGSARHAVPTTVSVKFRSTGNVYVVPRGYVTVTDPRGKRVAKGTINPESNLILPETSRKLIATMQPIADSNTSGKYTITAYYRYDGQAEFAVKAVSFQRGGLPVRQIISSTLTGAVLLFIVYKIHHIVRTRRWKKQRRQNTA